MHGYGGITRRNRGGAERPADGIAVFQRTVQVLALITLAAIAAVLLFGCGPCDAEVTAAAVAAADARKANVTAEDHAAVILLSHPLPYTATVTQYGDGIAQPRTRFYVPSSAR